MCISMLIDYAGGPGARTPPLPVCGGSQCPLARLHELARLPGNPRGMHQALFIYSLIPESKETHAVETRPVARGPNTNTLG